jgi:hypothetical protein
VPAREAAAQFKIWAAKNGMLGSDRLIEDRETELDRSLVGERRAAAADILQRRHITFIGSNEATNEVVVYTNTRVLQKELGFLPNEIDDTQVTYLKAAAATITGRPTPSVGISPYHLRGRRYTCGTSIYVGNMIGAGTLGALVRGSSNNILYGLSNNHVTGGCNYAEPTLPIIAPGSLDVKAGGLDPFTIGHHYQCMPFVDGAELNVDAQSNLDAAIFKIKDEDIVSSMQRSSYDTPTLVMDHSDNMEVQKIGRTTGITQGKIRATSAGAEDVEYFIEETGVKKSVFFDPMFVVTGSPNAFAEMGDSGSLVTHLSSDGNRYAIGIVVAVSKDGVLTYATPICKVLDYFGVALVGGHRI